jgi:hypothetical protein
MGLLLAIAAVAVVTGCSRRKPAEVNDITASFKVNRTRAPLGSAIEVTYTWTTGPAFKSLGKDYRAMVHVLDGQGGVVFDDDHALTPPTSSWEPGKTYTYTRTKFVPVIPYVGEVSIRMGLYKERERVALKGEDAGMLEFKVATMELLPQTDNIFLVQKEGWHAPETSPQNPALERQWIKKEALVSFKNPRKDVILYLEADTNYKAFPQPPILTISAGQNVGLTLPIENSEVFLKKIRFKAADLGKEDWVDLRLAMNQSFVPKQLTPPLNQDDRELGLLVYHLYVSEADKVGSLPEQEVVDAGPLAPQPVAAMAKTSGKATPVKGGAGAPPVKPVSGRPVAMTPHTSRP